MDLKTLTDEELQTLQNETVAEQERRQAIANIPAQLAALAATYEAGGGDKEALREALG